MSKSSTKKKRSVKPKFGFSLRFKSTIMSNIMIVMLVTMIVVTLAIALSSYSAIKKMQDKLPADFYSSMEVFDNQKQTAEKFEARLPEIQKIINSSIIKNYNVHDILVAYHNGPKIYTTLDNEDRDKNVIKYSYAKDETNLYKFHLKQSDKYSVLKSRKISFPLSFYKKDEAGNYITDASSKHVVDKEYDIFLVIPPATTEDIDGFVEYVKGIFCAVLFACLVVVFILARSISKPLSVMEKTVSQVANGDLSGRLEYTKYDEINRLVQSYNMMTNALQRLYSSLEAQVQDRTKELKSAYAELQSTQAMMVHSEKMKSLGELVAGIMHEINNPINFIYGNMTHLNNYSNDLIQIIEEYNKVSDSLKPEEKEVIENLKQDIDYDFLKSDLPDLIKSCKEGADRAKNIIQDLKSFSRMEGASITDVDVPHEFETTLNILHNKIKNKAEIHKEYMDNPPKIEAFGGQLNQVFMNILDNAVGAIKEKGDIWIRINEDKSKKNLIIEIEDNGIGMDEETARKVFNPFFTTKPVGQGTGLGLSITYKIIKNHQGDIKVESQPNLGTKFIITLPINIDRENLSVSAANGESNG